MKTKMKITFKGVEKEVNFTEPQSKIMLRLLNGEKVIQIKDALMWYSENGCTERVYIKVFCGAMYALEKAFKVNFYNEYVIKF